MAATPIWVTTQEAVELLEVDKSTVTRRIDGGMRDIVNQQSTD